MAGTVSAGRAVLTLSVDDKEVAAKFARTQRSMRNLGRNLSAVGRRFQLLGGAIVAPLTVAVTAFTKVGDELNKMSARTGVSVEALSELKFAAEQSGSSLSTVEKGVKGMQRTLLDASLGLSTANDALNLMGLNLRDLEGQAPEVQFQKMMDSLASIEDPSKRAAVALKAFGRAGQELLPMVETMGSLRQEARDLGLVINEETAQGAADLADAFNRVKSIATILAVEIGAALAPALEKFAAIVIEILPGFIEFIRANETAVTVVAAVGAGLILTGTALATFGTIATAAATGVNLTVAALGRLRIALIALSRHPWIVLLTAALAGLAYATNNFGIGSGDLSTGGIPATAAQGAGTDVSSQLADVQRELAALPRTPSLATPATGQAVPASAVERSMLRELRSQTRVAQETLRQIENGGFFAGGT